MSPAADIGIACLQQVVDENPGRIGFDSGSFGIQSFDVGLASERHQNFIRDDALYLATTVQKNAASSVHSFRAEQFRAKEDSNPFALEAAADDFRGVRVIVRQEPVAAHNDSHFAAKAPECLRQLAADGSAPDDEKCFGKGLKGKNRFIGEVARFRKARQVRRGGPGSRRERLL